MIKDWNEEKKDYMYVIIRLASSKSNYRGSFKSPILSIREALFLWTNQN